MDRSPSKKAWRDVQEQQLPLLHVSFPTLWERAYFFERNHTITESLEHAYQLSINNIVPGTFLRPCDPHNLKLLLLSLSSSLPQQPSQSGSGGGDATPTEGATAPKAACTTQQDALKASTRNYVINSDRLASSS